MGYFYIILSLLCRFVPFRNLIKAILDRRCILESLSGDHRNINVYTVSVPLAGFWTVWVKGSLEFDARCEIVRIERGTPGHNPLDVSAARLRR